VKVSGGSTGALAPPKLDLAPQSLRSNWAKKLYYGYHNTITNAVILKNNAGLKNLQFNRSKNGPYLAEPSVVPLHRLIACIFVP